jgi:ABC-type Fe3+/spermidine/putrescine transport system ATPase subunit
VTHDLRRAHPLADRIAVLLEGEIAQLGARETVLAHPATPRVARTVGMTNLIQGTVLEEQSNGLRLVEIDAEHRIPVAEPLPTGTEVCVGIRPEHLKLETGRGEGAPIGEGRVRSIVSDGWTSTVVLDYAGAELRTHLIAGRGLARKLSPGDSMTLSVRPGDVHVMGG